jgi:hypothetical protein
MWIVQAAAESTLDDVASSRGMPGQPSRFAARTEMLDDH